mmetsp:Transcript_8889/g.25494  ORF Transcript_8889/g.25494 Transcript_8889/m.25494 type:complete len:218 (+) Transcript_8889:439-1092(+)
MDCRRTHHHCGLCLRRPGAGGECDDGGYELGRQHVPADGLAHHLLQQVDAGRHHHLCRRRVPVGLSWPRAPRRRIAGNDVADAIKLRMVSGIARRRGYLRLRHRGDAQCRARLLPEDPRVGRAHQHPRGRHRQRCRLLWHARGLGLDTQHVLLRLRRARVVDAIGEGSSVVRCGDVCAVAIVHPDAHQHAHRLDRVEGRRDHQADAAILGVILGLHP